MVPRRLLYPVCICLMPFLLLVFGNCTQMSPEEKKAAHLERGKKYFEQGSIKKPSLNTKTSFKLIPEMRTDIISWL